MTSGFSWGLPTAAAQVGPAMAKNAMTPEEQLEDLQRRFQLLEGDSSSQLREFEFEHERVSAFCMLCALDACRFQGTQSNIRDRQAEHTAKQGQLISLAKALVSRPHVPATLASGDHRPDEG